MKTETALEYNIIEESRDALPVIIVAAGSFTRMGGINKQLAEIGGVPVIIRTLLAFENNENISNIVLVVRADDIFSLQLLTEKYGISKLSDIICGGNSRQESVLKGLSRVPQANSVLIHDGARPLVDKTTVNAVIEALKSYSAVTCATPIVDTVKQINTDGEVKKTLNRSELVAVQTPQGVRLNDYKAAIEKIGDVSDFTDDTSVMEAAGFKVKTVEGSRNNIKITTPIDILIAEKILEEAQCE